MAATEALRALIDAILVFPGDRRGEMTVSLRGDLAAFLHAAGEPDVGRRWTAKRPLPWVGTAVLVLAWEYWERWMRGQDLNL